MYERSSPINGINFTNFGLSQLNTSLIDFSGSDKAFTKSVNKSLAGNGGVSLLPIYFSGLKSFTNFLKSNEFKKGFIVIIFHR
jgi:hypothetical protein